MPAFGSGEMFGVTKTPKSVASFTPPPSRRSPSPFAPGAAWQAAHPPAQNTVSPALASPAATPFSSAASSGCGALASHPTPATRTTAIAKARATARNRMAAFPDAFGPGPDTPYLTR